MPHESGISTAKVHPRVLVVEDQTFQRRALCRLLRAAGAAEVAESADGEQALAVLGASPDTAWIVISDLDMPNVDGMEFMRRLGTTCPAAKLVILSAQEPDMLRTVKLLADQNGIALLDVIRKPASTEQLRAILEHGLHMPASVPPPPAALRSLSSEETAHCLREGRLHAYFQPKVNIETGRTAGCEALARIIHPSQGVLAPAAFLGAIGSLGMQRELTSCIVSDSARMIQLLRKRGLTSTVSINLPLECLSEPGDAVRLEAYTDSLGISASDLVLEVTETSAVSQSSIGTENLARLRMRGFSLSIDDFGTGYSSLEQLLRLPFSELKLDRSFVARLAVDPAAWSMVEATLGMARRLGLTTCAEGVETTRELELLRKLGADLAQGYLFSQPLPADKFLAWIEHDARRHGVHSDMHDEDGRQCAEGGLRAPLARNGA